MADTNVNYTNEEILDTDDNIQHGIDDNPNHDAEKGAAIGGVGSAVVGAIAGSAVGPVGTLIGAAVGGVAGAVASGLGVAAVDTVDNDDTVTGLGDGATPDVNNASRYDTLDTGDTDVLPGNRTPGIQTGGYDADGTPDTRGVMEKTADAVTGDRFDDKTGKPVDGTTTTAMGDTDVLPGNRTPGIQTGGRDADGTPDTRGVMEKTADAVTGDNMDDKTGKPVSGTTNRY